MTWPLSLAGELYNTSMGCAVRLRSGSALPLTSGVTVESSTVFMEHFLCAWLA